MTAQNDMPYTYSENILYGDNKRTLEDVVSAIEYHTIRTRFSPCNNNIIKIKNGFYIYTINLIDTSVKLDFEFLDGFQGGYMFEALVYNGTGSSITPNFEKANSSDPALNFYKATNIPANFENSKLYHLEFLSYNGLDWLVNCKAQYTTMSTLNTNIILPWGIFPDENLYPANSLYPKDINTR